VSRDLTPSLVAGLRTGDASAAELLEELYREPLRRFALGYLRDAGEAEDATQEVFVKVLESTSVPERFRAWIYRIARNHCLNRLQSRRGAVDDRALTSEPGAVLSQTGHLSRMVRVEEGERLRALMESLALEQREVLHLRYSEELSRDEIAEVLDLSVSVVKSRLYEGMKKLRELA